MNEYAENPKRKKACKINNKVNEYIDQYFNEDLYRSVDDIYNKNASERQYYTMPVTEIPNNQDKFAQWLYGNDEKTCKEGNLLKCKYFLKIILKMEKFNEDHLKYFNKEHRVGTDNCARESEDDQNKRMEDYMLFNSYRGNVLKCDNEVKKLESLW